MTYPGGWQPAPQPPPSGPQIRLSLDTVQWLHVVTFGLGVLLLFLGFAPWVRIPVRVSFLGTVGESLSGYQGGLATTPALAFVAGTLALLAVLPGGSGMPGPLVPVLAMGLTLDYLFSIFALYSGLELAAGGIIVLLFSIVQSATAWTAYYLDRRRARVIPAPYAPPPPGPYPPPR